MLPENSIETGLALTMYKRSQRLMGNTFTLAIYAEDSCWADHCLDQAIAEIKRIEQLLTTFDNNSQTCRINAMAGVASVVVDREVFDLIKRSLKISALTEGAFDITYGSLNKRLWNFDTTMTKLPDRSTAKEMVKLINYRNVVLDETNGTVMLTKKGMRIGFGGIGKGYAADRAKQVLIQLGISSGVVNASGDLITWGKPPGKNDWTIGIADPHTKIPFSFLTLRNIGVATSGDYEKFITINGKRYSHTIDPKTGFPVTGIKSVTVLSPYAELSDAMTTPLTVMGVPAALHLINQLKKLACIIIDEEDRVHTSANITIQ